MNAAFLGLLAMLFLPVSGMASDVGRERQYADVITRTLVIGDFVMLEADDTEFLGLYAESEKNNSKGVVILLHDGGGQPNQKPLIHALRTRLPDHNWETLSLQMPLREAGAGLEDYYALLPDAAARIQAGIDFLNAQERRTIILAGYGLGSLMAVYFQSENQAKEVKAIVAISLPVPETDAAMVQTLDFLSGIKLPVLDIYAALDLPIVISSARKRRLAAKQNPDYRQIRIDDEGHNFQHSEDLVVKRIYSWLSLVE